MMNKSDSPIHALKLATEKLEQFARQIDAEIIPHVLDLELEEGLVLAKKSGPLERTIDLARYFIYSQFSGKVREKQEKKRALLQQEVHHWSEVVRRNYLLIQKLNHGTPEQQALASSAMQAVERYNSVLARTRNRPPTWSARISRFVYEKCGLALSVKPIHIPQPATVLKRYSKSTSDASSQKIACLTLAHEPILKQEDEAFRVKAISLLRTYGIRFTSAAEEFLSIRSTPIQATQEGKRVLITQILKPFPGETIEFKGEFQRDAERSIPIADSFEVLTKSDQTGFPHPSQHNGWALADLMIPACPHQLDLLPKFNKLYIQKQNVALELLPEGNLIAHARSLLKLKKQVFGQSSMQLIGKHHELSLAMLGQSEHPAIDRYFKRLEALPFDYHCEVQELINSTFIARPFEKIKDVCLHQNSNLKSQTLATLFNQEMEQALQELSSLGNIDFATLEYIALIGTLIGSAACVIILQHLSESFGFTPPMLSDFALKMQTALYKQILDFQSEIINPELTAEKVLKRMLEQLDEEIALFLSDSFEDLNMPAADYVTELEAYFLSRKQQHIK